MSHLPQQLSVRNLQDGSDRSSPNGANNSQQHHQLAPTAGEQEEGVISHTTSADTDHYQRPPGRRDTFQYSEFNPSLFPGGMLATATGASAVPMGHAARTHGHLTTKQDGVGAPSLRGRLNEGTLHRHSIQLGGGSSHGAGGGSAPGPQHQQASGEDGVVVIQRPLGKVVEEVKKQNTWAQQYTFSSTLRRAITTTDDTFTSFEEEIEKEIALLRSDPKKYGLYVEQLAVLGSPYVLQDDVYFDSEEAVEEMICEWCQVPVSAFEPQSGTSESAAPSRGSSKHGRNEDSQSQSQTRPHSKAGSSSGRSQSTNTAGGTGTGGGSKAGAETAPVTVTLADFGLLLQPCTVAASGVTGLNLQQLREHVASQQRYRAVLEKVKEELRGHWRHANTMQLTAWQSADEKKTKRKRGASLRKQSVSASPRPASSSGRPVSPTPQGTQGDASDGKSVVDTQRDAARVALHNTYKEQMLALQTMLRKVMETCRRAIAGANLILETVRALRQVRPCEKLLRPSRGLKIAARDVVNELHAVVPPEQSHLVQAPHLQFLTDGTPGELLPTGGNHRQVYSQEEGDDGNRGSPFSPDAPVTETENESGNEVDTSTDSGPHNHTVNQFILADAVQTEAAVEDCRLPATCYLREELEALAMVGRQSCERYGFVSREVRGAQLYTMQAGDSASPRDIVIGMLLGVAVPEFILGAHTFPSGAQPSSPLVREHASRATNGEGQQNNTDGGVRDPHTQHSLMAEAKEGTQGEMFFVLNALEKEQEEEAREAVGGFQDSSFGSGNEEARHKAPLSADNKLHINTNASSNNLFQFHWKGIPHPSSDAAAYHLSEDLRKATTTQQRLSAEAVLRLGPLLWGAANQIGVAWQQVHGPQSIPAYDHEPVGSLQQLGDPTHLKAGASASVTTASHHTGDDFNHNKNNNNNGSSAHSKKPMLIATTVLLGCGYETIESVSQRQNLSVDETRRLVLSDQGADAFDGSLGATGGNTNKHHHHTIRRAMVDLHSQHGVQLLQPQTHPIWIYPTALQQGHSSVVVLALQTAPQVEENALLPPHETDDPTGAGVSTSQDQVSYKQKKKKVRIGAALTPQEPPAPIPPAPVHTQEMLLQRSLVDPNIFLVLLDVPSICKRYNNAPVLVHLYEKCYEEDDGEDEGAAEEEEGGYAAAGDGHEGYEPIGFVRLQCLPQQTTIGNPVRTVNTLRQNNMSTTFNATNHYTHTYNNNNNNNFSSSSVKMGIGMDGVSNVVGASSAAVTGGAPQPTTTISNGVLPLVDYTAGLKFPFSSPSSAAALAASIPTDASCAGWPATTSYFMEREGMILAPLSANLSSALAATVAETGNLRQNMNRTGSSNTNSVRFQVRFAPKQLSSSCRSAISSIKRLLKKLYRQEKEEQLKLEEIRALRKEKEEEEELLRLEELEANATEAESGSHPNGNNPNQNNSSGQEEGNEAAKISTTKGKSKATKKTAADGGRVNAAAHVNGGTTTNNSSLDPAECEALFVLPTPEIFHFMAELNILPKPLRSAASSPPTGSDALSPHSPPAAVGTSPLTATTAGVASSLHLGAIDTQVFYLLPVQDHEKAAQTLKNDAKKLKQYVEEVFLPKTSKEQARLERECEKKKGKELLKFKSHVEEFEAKVALVTQELQQLTALANTVYQESSRRSRDYVLRQSRIEDLEKQLRLLEEKEEIEMEETSHSDLTSSQANPNKNTYSHHQDASARTGKVNQRVSKVQLLFIPKNNARANYLSNSSVSSAFTNNTTTKNATHTVNGNGVPNHNLKQLEPIFSNEDGTLYEADVLVPKDFTGRAVLLVDDRETVIWAVSPFTPSSSSSSPA